MREPEAAADQPAIPEQRLDLLRRRVGGDVEILGMAADQQVAYGTTDQVGGKAALAQPVQDAQCIRADVLARDAVAIAGNDAGSAQACCHGFRHGFSGPDSFRPKCRWQCLGDRVVKPLY